MKKSWTLAFALFLVLALLCGCQNKESAAPEPAKTLEESAAMLDTIVSKIEAVNTVGNARKIDDFTVENEMQLTMDNLVAYGGDVTNNQADCALVFVALCKDGKAAEVQKQLEAYRQTMTSTLYIEFANKVEKAKEARVLTSGNYVMLVMAGIDGASYEQIDKAINDALTA